MGHMLSNQQDSLPVEFHFAGPFRPEGAFLQCGVTVDIPKRQHVAGWAAQGFAMDVLLRLLQGGDFFLFYQAAGWLYPYMRRKACDYAWNP